MLFRLFYIMILALDISTAIVGISIFDEDYKLHEMSFFKFGKKRSIFEKLSDFIDHFEKYSELNFTNIAIEEPLKKFAGKFSNADTIQKLTQMNALMSGYLYTKHKVEPVYYNVQTARKTAFPNLTIPQSHPSKKTLIWQAVMEAEPTLNWQYTKGGKLIEGTFDMADSYVVGSAHIVSLIKQKSAKKNLVIEKSK